MNNFQFALWFLFLAIGVFQGLFISPLLLKHKTNASRWLAVLVLSITLVLCNYIAIHLRIYHVWPHFLFVPLPLLFLIGPSYYFYIKSLIDKRFKLSFKHYFHFLLFFMVIAYHWQFYSLSGETKVRVLDSVTTRIIKNVSFETLIYVAVHVIQTLYYLTRSYLSLRIMNKSPNCDDKLLTKWLQGFSLAFGCYWVVMFLWMLYLTLADSFFFEVDFIVMLSSSILINTLAYFVVYRNQEFNQYLLALIPEKYRKSSLSKEQSLGILRKVITLMEGEKLFLDPDLKIFDLAKRLSTSTNVISQVLNQELNKNFHEFVNGYRLDEAVKKLSNLDLAHITILSVAMESGFNNKNTFNRLFKQYLGLTPTEFVQNAN